MTPPAKRLNPTTGDALGSIPAVTSKQGPDAEVEEYTVATSAEARAFKQRAIALGPKGLERTLDDEPAAVLFRTSRREAKMVAHLYRELEDLSRRKGARIQLADNRSRPEDEGGSGGWVRSSSIAKGTEVGESRGEERVVSEAGKEEG